MQPATAGFPWVELICDIGLATLCQSQTPIEAVARDPLRARDREASPPLLPPKVTRTTQIAAREVWRSSIAPHVTETQGRGQGDFITP
jgi:hypothetical protein